MCSDDFQVLEQAADGSLVPVEAPPAQTLRGRCLGEPGAVVAASMEGDGLHARVRLTDGSSAWIQPIAGHVPGFEQNQYVVYNSEDVISEALGCGTNDMMALDAVGGATTGEATTAEANGGCIAKLAIDADFEFVQLHGGNVTSHIQTIINNVNVQYERDVGITHQITTTVLRSAEPNPYTSSDAFTLLSQLRTEWEVNQTAVDRNLVQLFTGKELLGNTIGIAWVGSVCTSFQYSLVQSSFNSTISTDACASDLSAHEFGHSWNARHCRCSSYTMNSFITCANRFHPKRTRSKIKSYRDSLSCLTDCNGGDPPPDEGCTSDPIVASHVCAPPSKKNLCLEIHVTITCDGAPVDGVAVTVQLTGSQFDVPTGSGSTNSSGLVTFRLRCRQAQSLTYTSEVISIGGAAPGGGDVSISCDI